jgi:flavin-dependent dehydrogenase
VSDVSEVDYFVIGAGIAGMTFRHHLRSDSVVVADFHPGRYKIGESIIPPHFFHRALRPVLERARTLPSASAKRGTIFVADDGVSFFHSFYDAAYTIHLDRRELEALYRELFDISILEERVLDVDVENKIVRTENRSFRVRRQIVDCSGPAMVLARKLGIAREVWPVWAGWSYWDVQACDDRRFWMDVQARGVPFHRFDDVSGELRPSEVDPTLPASEVTMLTRFADGIWTWQIPLYHARLLSFGVVTRHGTVDRATYLDIARRALGAQYDARPRAWGGEGPHDRFHKRDRFAWTAERFATKDWLLVGDAAFFGDPVYSVGTGLATNQAIRAATLLNDFDWEGGAHEVFDRRTAEVFARAKLAYDQWYGGAVTTEGAVAERIQSGFLNGLDLHFRAGEAYVDLWDVVAPDDQSQDPHNERTSSGGHGASTEFSVASLPAALRDGAPWSLERVARERGGLALWWRHGAETIAMRIELRTEGGRAFQLAGPFALSYRAVEGASLGPAGRALFETYARRVMSEQRALLALIEAE